MSRSRNLFGYFRFNKQLVLCGNQVFLVYLASYCFPAVLVSKLFYFYYVIVYFRLVSVVTEGEHLFAAK